VSSIFSGYSFEIFGRKITLFLSLLLTAFTITIMPYSSPSLLLLTLCRVGVTVFIAPLYSHPLVNDYVAKESRGKAFAFSAIGALIGDLIVFVVILTATRGMQIH
jgi:MFS family permease